MKYIINSERLRMNAQLFRELNVELYYPTKVNFEEKLIHEIDSVINGYEVDSISHIMILVDKFKVAPRRILYSYPLKSAEEIQQAVNMGVNRFIVDNYNEMRYIANTYKELEIDIIIRISVADIIAPSSDYVFKWGVSVKDVNRLITAIHSPHKFEGISFYIPQEVNTIENFHKVFKTMENILHNNNIRIIDIGGGLDPEELRTVLSSIKNTIDRSTRIIVEPGRSFVGSCVDLLAEVIAIRTYRQNKLVFLDTGIYNGLIDTVIKNKHFDISLFGAEGNQSSYCEYIVCGKSSDISDVMGRYQLPIQLKKGDILRISGCGAYCSEMETSFYKTHDSKYEVH